MDVQIHTLLYCWIKAAVNPKYYILNFKILSFASQNHQVWDTFLCLNTAHFNSTFFFLEMRISLLSINDPSFSPTIWTNSNPLSTIPMLYKIGFSGWRHV